MLQLAQLFFSCFIKPLDEYFVVRFVSHYVLGYRDNERRGLHLYLWTINGILINKNLGNNKHLCYKFVQSLCQRNAWTCAATPATGLEWRATSTFCQLNCLLFWLKGIKKKHYWELKSFCTLLIKMRSFTHVYPSHLSLYLINSFNNYLVIFFYYQSMCRSHPIPHSTPLFLKKMILSFIISI